MVAIHLFFFDQILCEVQKEVAGSLRAENIQTEMLQLDPSTIHSSLFSLCPATPQTANVAISQEGIYYAVGYIPDVLEVSLPQMHMLCRTLCPRRDF